MGYCTQKDILYDELNAVEHLSYFGALKQKSGQVLHQEISQIIS